MTKDETGSISSNHAKDNQIRGGFSSSLGHYKENEINSAEYIGLRRLEESKDSSSINEDLNSS
jgi:hypothetical protein